MLETAGELGAEGRKNRSFPKRVSPSAPRHRPGSCASGMRRLPLRRQVDHGGRSNVRQHTNSCCPHVAQRSRAPSGFPRRRASSPQRPQNPQICGKCWKWLLFLPDWSRFRKPLLYPLSYGGKLLKQLANLACPSARCKGCVPRSYLLPVIPSTGRVPSTPPLV